MIYNVSIEPVLILGGGRVGRATARAFAEREIDYRIVGANTMLNLLKHSQILMLAEGLDLFKVPVPRSLVGRSIAESGVRERSGASIVAIGEGERMEVNPDPGARLPAGAEIILIGSVEAEDRFLALFPEAREGGRRAKSEPPAGLGAGGGPRYSWRGARCHRSASSSARSSRGCGPTAQRT